MPARDQAYRQARPKKKTTSRGPQGLPSIRTPIAHAPVQSQSSAPAFKPLTTTRPFAPAQRQARKRSQAARRKVPSSPLLRRPPLIAPERMTSAQRQAVVRQGRAAVNRARGNESVQQFYETASPLDRKLIEHLSKIDAYERAAKTPAGYKPTPLKAGGTAEHHTQIGLPFATIDVTAIGNAIDRKLSGEGHENLRVLETPYQVLRALAEHPGGIPKTAKGAADMAVGAVAAPFELAGETVSGALHGDPLRGVRRIAKTAAKDYSRRYAPLIAGNAAEFRRRIGEEGAAPELADIATVVAPGGAAVGRALGAAARGGALGSAARELATADRPLLREAAGHAVEQDVSRNLFRATGQRAQDAARGRAQRRRVTRAERAGTRVRGLQPGEGEVVRTTQRGQRRSQERVAAKNSGRAHLAHRQEMTREIDQGTRRSLLKLTVKQRHAVFHVIQGIVRADDPEAAVRQLSRREKQILKERQRTGVKDVPRALKRTNDELETVRFLKRHAKEIFTPALEEFRRAEVERSHRVEAGDPAVTGRTAEVHRLRVQGHTLGLEHPHAKTKALIAAAHEAGELTDDEARLALAEADRLRPAMDKAFIKAVRQRARANGLPEPGYVHHSGRDLYPRSDFATGQGGRAVQGVKQSALKLFRAGHADTSAEAFVQTLARGIKRKANWDLVDRQFRSLAAKAPDVAELRRILGREHVHGDQLSIEDLRKVLDDQGLDFRDWAYVNPGRFRVHAQHETRELHLDDHNPEEMSGLGLRQAIEAATDAGEDLDRFKSTRGWYLMPRASYDELHAAVKESGMRGRVAGKIQTAQSRLLLASPSWLQIQIASEGGLAGIGMRGNLPDFIKGPIWYSRLPDGEKQAVDLMLGASVYEHGVPHIGAASESSLINAYRAFRRTAFMQRAGRVNPLNLVFQIDNAKGNLFRRAVLYNRLKRTAYQRMGKQVGQLGRLQETITHVLGLGPEEQIKALLEDRATVEQHAQAVNDLLGDFTTYTARERREFKRGIMFYGYLRYSLRLAFYTLPIKHPIAGAIAAKLGQLHVEEVKDLLGGDEAPWAFSRIFIEGKGGELKSIDLARLNPLTNPIVSVIEEGPKALGGLVSPLAQGIIDQISGEHTYSGQPYRGHGSAETGSAEDLDARVRIAVRDLLKTSWAYREGEKLSTKGETQTDDALLGSPRPIQYRSAEAIAREESKREAAGSPLEQILHDAVPWLPKVDTTRDTVAKLRREKGLPPRSTSTPARGRRTGRPTRQVASGSRVDQALVREALKGGSAGLSPRVEKALIRAAGG